MALEAQWLQNRTYSAREDRALVAAIATEGVIGEAFAVTAKTPASYGIDVAAGSAVVAGDDQPYQGSYLVSSTAVESPTITAPPGSNSRYDIVVLRVQDTDAGGAAGDDAVVAVIAGDPSAAPVAPAVPASALLLATIGPITPGKTSIVAGDIVDERAASQPPALAVAHQTSTPWTSFTPTWSNLTLGTGATQTWMYRYDGGDMLIAGSVTLGTGGAITGTAFFTLPDSRTSANNGINSYGIAVLLDADGADQIGAATVAPNSTAVQFRTAAATTVTATAPWTWAANDVIRVSSFRVPVA